MSAADDLVAGLGVTQSVKPRAYDGGAREAVSTHGHALALNAHDDAKREQRPRGGSRRSAPSPRSIPRNACGRIARAVPKFPASRAIGATVLLQSPALTYR